MGYDPNNVIWTVNIFNNLNQFVHSDCYVINKAKLIAGGTLTYATDFTIFHDPCDTAPDNLQNIDFAPCVTFGQTAASGVNYILDNGWFGGTSATDFSLRFVRVSRINGVGAAATLDCMGDANFIQTDGCYNSNILDASQPGGCTAINVNGTNISSPPVLRNGKIWFANTVGADLAGCPDPRTTSTATKAELDWVQLDPSVLPNPLGSPALQAARITDPVLSYFFPSISANSCDGVMVGFSSSGPNAGQFASAMYTGRLAADPINTMQPVAVLHAGLADYLKEFTGGR